MGSIGVMSGGTDIFECISNDNLKDFMKIVKSYPRATNESNMELLMKYRDGDEAAKDLLIKTNLRLVIYYASKFLTNNYELLDVIQEGIIGFMGAMDSYDETRGEATFATYAGTCINHAIMTGLENDRLIRQPRNFSNAIRKYKKYTAKYEELGQELPEDTQICIDLNITKACLERVKKHHLLYSVSLDAPMKPDGTALGALLSDQAEDYSDLEKVMLDKQLLIALKYNLSSYEYYVLYNRVFRENSYSKEKIAATVHMEGKSVSRVENKCLGQLRQILLSSDGLDQLREIPVEFQKHMDDMREEPINPELIVKYLFFRDTLSEQERMVLKAIIHSPYQPDTKSFLDQLGMDPETYHVVINSLKEKLNIQDEELSGIYELFKASILGQYKSKICDIDLDIELQNSQTNKQYIAAIWEGLSYGDALYIIEESGVKVPSNMRLLLERYFNARPKNDKYTDREIAEREVNTLLHGLNVQNNLSTSDLYTTLMKHKEKFTDEQYMYLMMRLFKRVSLHDFKKKYPNSNLTNGYGYYLINRLEVLYFNVLNYQELHFTKEKYLQVRELCLKKLDSKKIALLDMFYGVGQEKCSSEKIAETLGIPEDEVRFKVKDAKDAAHRLYLNKTRGIIIEEEQYIPYIEDMSVDLNDITRTLLREFVIEKKSYDELVAIHKLSRHKVSTTITEGIRKIDFYRFGILRVAEKYSTRDKQLALQDKKFNDQERDIITYLLNDEGTYEEAATKFKTTKQKVDNLMGKFFTLCRTIKVSHVSLEAIDIEREVNAHISESILTQNERLVLSMLYGIKSDLNPTGVTLSKEEFRKQYPNLADRLRKLLPTALDSIRAKKIGLTRASLSYMERNQLKKSLRDSRIPITQKERELLYYSFELNGYPYKTLDELETLYGERKGSLKRRIQRAFVAIYKYENLELEPVFSYESDIEPKLKYFTKADQKVLIDKYQHQFNYETIAKRNGLTVSQVESLLFRLDSHLNDLVEEKVQGFDFNYFWSIIHRKDVPFYGDKELAKQIFYLYYEKRMTANEIIEELKLDCSQSSIVRTVSLLQLAVLKRRIGIKKVRSYSLQEISDFYSVHQVSMNRDHRESYECYFKKNSVSTAAGELSFPSTSDISNVIILDLLKANNEVAFDIKHSTKKEVIDIIRKYRGELSSKTINTLSKIYGITQRELMSGSEQMKVLRFLSELNVKNKVLSLKMAA